MLRIRTCARGRRAPRALRAATFASAVLAPLTALLACAPASATRATRATRATAAPTTPVSDSGTVRNVEGRTLENLFAGRFPGVSVTRAGNGGLQLRIRGGSNSFLASEEPLYVVDGTPLPAGTGGIGFLNPNDVARIEVLKNPADVAVYGVRGANGVIRITTTRPGRR
jgi:TonB-dependent SusC/RagA subfamily outer membrane receptor